MLAPMAMEVRLSREMRLVDVTMIGVGAMIGAGIFVLTGIAAGVAGPALVVAFLLNGLVALLTAMAYAELGSAIHGAGGGYLWIKRALPDPSGFISGWMDWFAHAVACSLYALGFGAYLREVLVLARVPEHLLDTPLMTFEKWTALGACVLFGVINYRGASETGKAGNIVTTGKIIVLGVFIAAGLWSMGHRPGWQEAFQPFMTNGWAGIFAAMGLTFIAFEGYEIIAQASEEVRDPKVNVPRAVFLSLAIVIPIYLLVALVAIGAVVPPPGMEVTQYLAQEKEVALVAAADQFLAGGAIIILVGGLLSTLSALNATVYSSSRVAFAMARDASLPPAMARVHPKRQTPHVAIFTSVVLIGGMAVALPIEQVAAACGVMFLLLFGGVNVAVIRLRKLEPDLDRGFRVPLMPVVPIVAIVTMLFLAVYLLFDYPLAWAAAGAWIVVGAGVYYGYARKRERAHIEHERWMERIERREYRVLVALAHPKSLPGLMETALAIARENNGEVVAVAVEEVPEGEPLDAGRRRAAERQALLEEAVRYGRERGVNVHALLKLARRVSHGIVETAKEESCNFLVLGQPHAGSFLERLLASVVERVLRDAPCQVGIVYGHIPPGGVKRVLVPVTGGQNPRLAAELAPAFAGWFQAPVRAVTVVTLDATDEEADLLAAGARETLEGSGLDVQLEVIRRRDVVDGLTQSVQPGELVLIGAPSTGPVAGMLGETVPAALVTEDGPPVVVVRDVEAVHQLRFERLFFGR
jgi:basic amino acid/polyamine antiporter, APA family